MGLEFTDDGIPHFVENAVYRHDFTAVSKSDSIRKMTHCVLDPLGFSYDMVELVAAGVMKREELGSTGIGNGFAFPHLRHNCLGNLHLGVFFFPNGVDFVGLDGQMVKLIFLLLGAHDEIADHMIALESISALIRQQDKNALQMQNPKSNDWMKSWCVAGIRVANDSKKFLKGLSRR